MGATLLVMVLTVIAAGGMLALSERLINRPNHRAQTIPPVRRPRRKDFRDFKSFKDFEDDFLYDDDDDYPTDFKDEEDYDKPANHRRKKRNTNSEASRITATLIFVTLLMLLMALFKSM